MLTSLKNRLTNQPYFLFLLTGLILVIVTLFMFGQYVDFHLHDRYFVIPTNFLIWTLAGFFLIVWAIYKLTDKFLWTKKLIWTHFLITIFVLILLATIGFWQDKVLPPILRDIRNYKSIIEDQERMKIIAYPILTIFILGQVAYFVNLIGGLIKRRF